MNSCNGISPSGYRILIEPDEIKETLDDGAIVIPEEFRQQYQNATATGVIRAIGPESWTDKGIKWAQLSDRVIYDKYKGIIVNGLDGTEYRLMNDTDVMATIDPGINLGHLERRTKYER